MGKKICIGRKLKVIKLKKENSPGPKQTCLLFGFASSCKLVVFIASLIKLDFVCVFIISCYHLGCHTLSRPQSPRSGVQ